MYPKDPLTAHGITDALRDAEVLARSVSRSASGGDVRGYQRARDALSRGLLDVTDRVASFEWDLEEIRELHVGLSRHMKAEVRAMRAWDRGPSTNGAGPRAAPATAAAR